MEKLDIPAANWINDTLPIQLNRETGRLKVYHDWYTLNHGTVRDGRVLLWELYTIRDADGRGVFSVIRYADTEEWRGACAGIVREGSDPYVVAAQVLANVA